MSAYKGSYTHEGFAGQLKDIPGGQAFEYRRSGPDVVSIGGNGNGLRYEITQYTPSLNAIYSHSKKYTDDLLRYVLYK